MLFTPDTTAAEAAMFGLTLEEASDPPFVLWPENVVPVDVFQGMMTQWRTGFAGPTGLDYGTLPVVLELHGITAKMHREVFEAIRVLENEALSIWAREREQRTRRK